MIVGDLTVKTEGFRINETDFNDADRIKSAKRMRQIMKEGQLSYSEMDYTFDSEYYRQECERRRCRAEGDK